MQKLSAAAAVTFGPGASNTDRAGSNGSKKGGGGSQTQSAWASPLTAKKKVALSSSSSSSRGNFVAVGGPAVGTGDGMLVFEEERGRGIGGAVWGGGAQAER